MNGFCGMAFKFEILLSLIHLKLDYILSHEVVKPKFSANLQFLVSTVWEKYKNAKSVSGPLVSLDTHSNFKCKTRQNWKWTQKKTYMKQFRSTKLYKISIKKIIKTK